MQTAIWKKPLFWIFFVILIAIPLVSFLLSPYFNKNITSVSPVKTQPLATSVQMPKSGSCLILEEEFCSQAEIIEAISVLTGQKFRRIGFRLPAGVPIFLPADGQVPKTKLNENVAFYKGYQAIVFDPNNPNGLRYKFSGDMKFDNMHSSNLHKGDIVGYMQNTSIDMQGYNLVFYIYTIDPDKREIINEEEMKKMIPQAKFEP